MIEFKESCRYVIEHYGRQYHVDRATGIGDWLKTRHTIIGEFICRGGKLSEWTGSYGSFSTGGVRKEDIVRVIFQGDQL
jgi:hypothetical protein